MENNNFVKILIGIVILFFIVKTCQNSKKRTYRNQYQETVQEWKKNPLDELIRDLSSEPSFSIILFDMNMEENTIRVNEYKHRYRILKNRPDTVLVETTDWKRVPESFFGQHINDMGMEIASKKDGKLHKEVAPAGYSQYVGNPQYGHWNQRNGSSFWEFYGKYAFMSSLFNMAAYPARRSYWNDYHGGYGSGRSWYGPSGKTMYGTSTYSKTTAGKQSTWGKKPSSFKQKVSTRVSRSTPSTSSKRYSSGSSYGSSKKSTRTTRSSSRYKSSSYRSRSGGFGK